MAFPVFFTSSSIPAMHIDWSDEESERSRNSEESARYSINEFTEGYHSYILDLPVFPLSTGSNYLLNASFKQTFYGSVLTPPPDMA